MGSSTSSQAAAAGGGAPKTDSWAKDHMSNGDLKSLALERTSTVGRPGEVNLEGEKSCKSGRMVWSTYIGDAVAACGDEDGIEMVC